MRSLVRWSRKSCGGWFLRLALILGGLAVLGLLLSWFATRDAGTSVSSPRIVSGAPDIIGTPVLRPSEEGAAASGGEAAPAPASAPAPEEVPAPVVAPPAQEMRSPGTVTPPHPEKSQPPPPEPESRKQVVTASSSTKEPEVSQEDGAVAAPPDPRPEPEPLGSHQKEVGDASGSLPQALPTAAPGHPPSLSVPVYPTRLPPAVKLNYELSRGALSGEGILSWKPGGTYQLKLEGRLPLIGAVLTQLSQGRIDAHGLAPERFSDRRFRRGELSADFKRGERYVSFSGTNVRHPLVPGTQDRLSWMVQLAAIAEAAPARVRSEPVALFVIGARGDAAVWSFRPVGVEKLTVRGQALNTVRLRREPRRPNDSLVEVWLAPGFHHLPVRARQTDDSGEDFELMLSTLPPDLQK